MVIVVMSPNAKGAGDLARHLSVTLGWPCVDATRSADAARQAIARAHDRRDHIVVRTGVLARADRQRTTSGMAQVRVIQADGSSPWRGWDDEEGPLAVDGEADPDGAIATIRETFGV
jgi:hypothetical protein